MRIRSVMIEGHPGLGDLKVAFCKDGEPAPRVVVLAGENGCGKSVLLAAIYQALVPENHLLAAGRVILEVELDDQGVAVLQSLGSDHGVLRIELRLQENDQVYDRQFFVRLSGDLWRPVPQHAFGEGLYRGILKRSFLSETSVSFEPKIIRAATGNMPEISDVPTRSAGPERDLATEIAQHFVNMRVADNEDYRRHGEEHGAPPPGWPNGSRDAVFRKAFHSIFPNKRMQGVAPSAFTLGHEVEFVEHGRRSTLAQLSTGEKQIVFRGGFLLSRRALMGGAVILVDEPEVGLHPNWQSGILDFYEQILFGEEWEGAGQLLLATHSPFVVHGSPSARHVVLVRNASDQVVASAFPAYPGVAAEVAIAAFNVLEFAADVSGFRKPTLLVEGPADELLLPEAWSRLRKHQPLPFEVRSAGGAPAIRTLLRQPSFRRGFAERRSAVVGLFDYDEAGYRNWDEVWDKAGNCLEVESDPKCGRTRRHVADPAWAMLLPVPPYRSDYVSGRRPCRSSLEIEHLFPDERLRGFTEEEQDRGGTYLYVPDSRKMALAEAARGFSDGDFAAFEPILKRMEQVISRTSNAASAVPQ